MSSCGASFADNWRAYASNRANVARLSWPGTRRMSHPQQSQALPLPQTHAPHAACNTMPTFAMGIGTHAGFFLSTTGSQSC